MGDLGALDLLVERLAASRLDAGAADLVVAAALGDAELAAAIGGDLPTRPAPSASDFPASPALFLSQITVVGFRGIAGSARLGLRPGPGLTLVVGRNGSGKSSFAEAAELALTGTASRWEKRSKVWEDGWSCLHHDGPRSIEVRLLPEGQKGETVVRRRWAATDALGGGTATAQAPGAAEVDVASLGLADALRSWRPFLSYNELGSLLDDGPSKLYDAIGSVLGLEEWVAIEGRLTAVRKEIEAAGKTARSGAVEIRTLMAGLDDARAADVLAALPDRGPWHLDAVEAVVTGDLHPPSDLAWFDGLAGLPLPDLDATAAAAEALRAALAEVDRVTGTDATRALLLAGLLEQALGYHGGHPQPGCPVCGTDDVLDADWAASTTTEVARLRTEAASASSAHDALATAVRVARRLVSDPPSHLIEPSDLVGVVDTAEAADRWARWAALPDDPAALADHLDAHAGDLVAAVSLVRKAAAAEVAERQDRWRPAATRVAAWLPGARAAVAREEAVGSLKAAAVWIADEANVVRNERFAPIATRVQSIWETLRQDSNVRLETVTLEGTKTRRRVELRVSVDDVAGAALSVMSQGELHGLALSLFLPRATLADSPFRFILVDDPVQAMDGSRVDGLARALHDVAATHQVVVFTHDERLPDACRRLGLPATVLEVARADQSQVSIRARRNPVDDYLDDARAILATAGYPDEARRRVVPGLLRNAIEAAGVEATRTQLLAQGWRHADIDRALAAAGKLLPRLSLALFGDVDRAGDVMGEVNRRWGRPAGDCIQALKVGAHDLIDDDPRQLVDQAEKLAHAISALR